MKLCDSLNCRLHVEIEREAEYPGSDKHVWRYPGQLGLAVPAKDLKGRQRFVVEQAITEGEPVALSEATYCAACAENIRPLLATLQKQLCVKPQTSTE